MSAAGADVHRDRLAVVFAPGLWPFRSRLDGVSWLIAEGIARALDAVPGFVGYVTPRAAVGGGEWGGERRVYRSLPPDALVRQECADLGAEWAVTGRLLADRQGLEVWLNLLDGASGYLLWTGRRAERSVAFLKQLNELAGELVRHMCESVPDPIDVRGVVPTTSFAALEAFARAYELRRVWGGDVETGLEIVASASRAAALDHRFEEAVGVLLEVGLDLVERVEGVARCEALRDRIVGSTDFEPARKLRQAAHERLLHLARLDKQT